MQKKVLLIVGMMLALVLALTACGGTETEATEAPAAATEAPAAVATEAPAEPAKVEGYECTDPLGCVEVAEGDPIVLASALVVSGPNASLGLDSQYASKSPSNSVAMSSVIRWNSKPKTAAVAPKAVKPPPPKSSPMKTSSVSSVTTAPALVPPPPPFTPMPVTS